MYIYVLLQDYDLANGKSRVLKWVSFLFVDGKESHVLGI